MTERQETHGTLKTLLMTLEIVVSDSHWGRALAKYATENVRVQVEKILDGEQVIWHFGAGYMRLLIDPVTLEVVWVEVPKYRENTIGTTTEMLCAGVSSTLERWYRFNVKPVDEGGKQ